MSCTARDLARIGGLMLDPGEVLSRRWVDTVWAAGDRDAWNTGDFSAYVPGGSYRDQWYRLPPPADALAGLGIGKGNPYRNKEGLNASIFQSGRGWSTIVQNDHVKLSASGLPTEDAAKLKAFELFEQGQTILKRRP